MELQLVRVEKPDDVNVILGQAHFIKTVEDLHETLITQVPGIRFGLAFCEASGPALVRWSGTDDELTALARDNARHLACGHLFIVFLRGCFPINVLNAIKAVPEVCGIFSATANPLQVVVTESDQGRGVLGVVDGIPSQGTESDAEIAKRKSFLRQIGYKL